MGNDERKQTQDIVKYWEDVKQCGHSGVLLEYKSMYLFWENFCIFVQWNVTSI